MTNNLIADLQAPRRYFLSHTPKHTPVCFLDVLQLLVLPKFNQKYLFSLSAQIYAYTLSCFQH